MADDNWQRSERILTCLAGKGRANGEALFTKLAARIKLCSPKWNRSCHRSTVPEVLWKRPPLPKLRDLIEVKPKNSKRENASGITKNRQSNRRRRNGRGLSCQRQKTRPKSGDKILNEEFSQDESNLQDLSLKRKPRLL
jgi:hypothetical protein